MIALVQVQDLGHSLLITVFLLNEGSKRKKSINIYIYINLNYVFLSIYIW